MCVLLSDYTCLLSRMFSQACSFISAFSPVLSHVCCHVFALICVLSLCSHMCALACVLLQLCSQVDWCLLTYVWSYVCALICVLSCACSHMYFHVCVRVLKCRNWFSHPCVLVKGHQVSQRGGQPRRALEAPGRFSEELNSTSLVISVGPTMVGAIWCDILKRGGEATSDFACKQ